MRKITLLALCVVLCGFERCNDPRIGMQFAGYTQLSPPSNLYVPGAIVVVELDPQKRAQLRLVCGPRANLGASYMARVSDTVSSSLRLSKSQRIELEADAVDRFRARTSVEDVQNVSVSFTNARLLEADDSEIFRLIYNRTEPCEAAVEARKQAGHNVTMVSSAFIADVTYDVSFKSSVNVDKRVTIDKMTAIAGKLGGGHTEVTDHTIKAVNLVIGVKTDQFYMGIKPQCAPKPRDHGSQDVLPAGVLEAGTEADAPLIPPAGGWANPVRGG